MRIVLCEGWGRKRIDGTGEDMGDLRVSVAFQTGGEEGSIDLVGSWS